MGAVEGSQGRLYSTRILCRSAHYDWICSARHMCCSSRPCGRWVDWKTHFYHFWHLINLLASLFTYLQKTTQISNLRTSVARKILWTECKQIQAQRPSVASNMWKVIQIVFISPKDHQISSILQNHLIVFISQKDHYIVFILQKCHQIVFIARLFLYHNGIIFKQGFTSASTLFKT